MISSKKPLLYNFHSYNVPDGVEELLDLLGFWRYWDTKECVHRIYEHMDRRRMKWMCRDFAGGTIEQWQKFLSEITGPEHLL